MQRQNAQWTLEKVQVDAQVYFVYKQWIRNNRMIEIPAEKTKERD